MKIKNNLITLFFSAILVFSFSLPLVVFSADIDKVSVEVIVAPVFLGQTSRIGIVVRRLASVATPVTAIWYISVDFGDGHPAEEDICVIDNAYTLHCAEYFPHEYTATGSYLVTARICANNDNSQCKVETATAVVNAPTCGNGTLEPPEECDDGDTVSGDGCSQDCKIEHPRPSLPTNDDLNPLEANTFGELFRDIVGALFWVAVVLGPLLIIAGGFMIIFAGLDPGKIVLGKKIILYTAVILGIILIIKAMTAFFAPDITF